MRKFFGSRDERRYARRCTVKIHPLKEGQGVSCSFLRKNPDITAISGPLIVHRKRDLVLALQWMAMKADSRVTVNLVGSFLDQVDKIVFYTRSFMVRWSHERDLCSPDANIQLKILMNGKIFLSYCVENICNSNYRILHIGTRLGYRSMREILETKVFDGVRGFDSTAGLPADLRYFEGPVTSTLLVSLLENFPLLECIVGGNEVIDRWIAPNRVPQNLRSLQVWVPPEDKDVIFQECRNVNTVHVGDDRGKHRVHERRSK